MKKGFFTPLRVGFVVLAGIVAAFIMITRVGSEWDVDETYVVYAYFNDVTGLAKKSQVRIAGIQVGEVEDVQLVDRRAKVTIRLRADIDLYEGVLQPDQSYRGGATITKKLSNLLGDNYVEITPGIEGARLADRDEIHNVLEGGGPEAILKDVEVITRDVAKITNTLAEVFGDDEGRQRLENVVKDIEDISHTIRTSTAENAEQLNRIVDNVEQLSADARMILRQGGQDVHTILRDIRAVSHDLRTVVERSSGRIDNTFDNVDDTLLSARLAIDKLDRSLAHVEEVTATLADGDGTVGHVLRDKTIANETESLLSETRELVGTATETVEGASNVIESIGRLETHVNLRNDYMVGFNSFKNVLSLKLQPKPTKWYLLELVLDPRGSTSTVRRTVDGVGTSSTFEEITETTSEMKFSFQFAGRYEFIAGRFGLIESSGGVGTNLYFFDDDLELVVDLFDFGFGPYPRMRAFTMLYLDLALPWRWSEHLYLSGGIDDPFNEGSYDYFFGAGLSFNDEDLKGLMTVAPMPSF